MLQFMFSGANDFNSYFIPVIKMLQKILSKVVENDHRSLVVVQFMFV